MKSIGTFFILFFLSSYAVGKENCSKKDLYTYTPGQNIESSADFYSCLISQGIYSKPIPAMIDLIASSKSPEFHEKYLSAVMSTIPREYEPLLYKKLRYQNLKLSPNTYSDLMYFFATYSYDKNHITSALKYLNKQIGTNYSRFPQSEFLRALIHYRKGKSLESLTSFTHLTKLKNPHKLEVIERVKNASYLNIARIQLENKNFDKSIEAYRSVSYRDNEWFDGLIELSLVMLSKGDFENAIGNAEFIKKSTEENVYKPWIPMVQSVGLLKICQFPEAKKSLEVYKETYGKTLKNVKKFISRNKSYGSYDVLLTVLTTPITEKSLKTIPSIVFYTARNSKILSTQESINKLIEEESETKKALHRLRRHSSSYVYKLLDASKKSLAKKIKLAQNNAGSEFNSALNTIVAEHKKLDKIMAIVDFENYARSSTNIALRVSGEKFKDKVNTAKRGESSWKYIGEFWTDEAGKFRSFIENKCKKQEVAKLQ